MAYEPHYRECPISGKQGVEVHDPGCECDYIEKMMERQTEEDDADRGHEEYMAQLERETEERQLAADARREEAELRRMEGSK